MDEYKVVRCVVLSILILLLACVWFGFDKNQKISEAIKLGVDPIVAKVAFEGSDESQTARAIYINQIKEKQND